jgi:hypothetical protein
MLEPYALKGARTVLRGGGEGDLTSLPDLAAALEINRKEQDAGFAPVTLISADQALNDAATAEGLTVDDPRSNP